MTIILCIMEFFRIFFICFVYKAKWQNKNIFVYTDKRHYGVERLNGLVWWNRFHFDQYILYSYLCLFTTEPLSCIYSPKRTLCTVFYVGTGAHSSVTWSLTTRQNKTESKSKPWGLFCYRSVVRLPSALWRGHARPFLCLYSESVLSLLSFLIGSRLQPDLMLTSFACWFLQGIKITAFHVTALTSCFDFSKPRKIKQWNDIFV